VCLHQFSLWWGHQSDLVDQIVGILLIIPVSHRDDILIMVVEHKTDRYGVENSCSPVRTPERSDRVDCGILISNWGKNASIESLELPLQ